MKTNWPSISIITVGLNCENILDKCYSSIAEQDYPKEKIEMILVDGGSTDKTKEIAAKYKVRIIDGGYKDNQEARRYVGFLHAKNDLLAYIDSDNFLPERNWLKKMVVPFLEDKEIVAAQPLRYHYDRTQSLMNRYFSLFGVNDPVAFYLGKADRLPWFQLKWNLLGEVENETGVYYKVRFSADLLPTVGCNGFFVRKSVFDKLDCKAENFFHIDVNLDLIKKGLDCFGIVKTTIIHATAETLRTAIKKRMLYMQVHHQKLNLYRRYKVFDSKERKDVLNLFKYIFFTCTLIRPFYDSIRGFLKIRDVAWFVHPFICVGFLFGYGYATFTSVLIRRSKSAFFKTCT